MNAFGPWGPYGQVGVSYDYAYFRFLEHLHFLDLGLLRICFIQVLLDPEINLGRPFLSLIYLDPLDAV